ncbi:phage baseplate assembly protein V [Nonomuraea sp. NPDC050153]|uniref:phage baseplate assembly protein V n=1 Tax=Nonomuraea sp. NPDC050153 TaxID=3364359 RepID=UPI0037BB395B
MDDRMARHMEDSGRRYWGKYRGFVEDRNDPEKLGRLRVRVPDLLGDAVTGWAWPVTPYGGAGVGLFALPKKDDIVWVEFVAGDLSEPLWSGCAWAKPGGRGELPQEALDGYPDAVVLRTASGHAIVLSDAKGRELITVRASNGAQVVLDPAADRITVKAGEVVVRGAGGEVEELATKSFVKDVFDLHQHATGVGPSSTPTPTSTPESLTTVLKAE